MRLEAGRIGVNDYGSLVELLTGYFEQVFPSYPPTDAQNMVQMLGAVAMQSNRLKAWGPE